MKISLFSVLVIVLAAQVWGKPESRNTRVTRSSYYPRRYGPTSSMANGRPNSNYPPPYAAYNAAPGGYPRYVPNRFASRNPEVDTRTALQVESHFRPEITPHPIGPTTITLLEHFAPVPPRSPSESSGDDHSSDSGY